MAGKSWVKWFPSDFLGGVADMSANELAVYVLVLNLIYDNGGPVALDTGRFGRRLQLRPSTVEATLDALFAAGKLILEGGLIGNRKAAEVLETRQKVSEKSSTSSRVRWEKSRENRTKTTDGECEGNADAMRPQCDTRYQIPDKEVSNETSPAVAADDLAEIRAMPDPKSRAWTLAKKVLIERGGVKPQKVGALVGAWMRDHKLSAEQLFGIAESAWKTGTLEPTAYMARAAANVATEEPSFDDVMLFPSPERQVFWMKDWLESPNQWPGARGPRPGTKGCRVSAEVQRQFGVTPFGEAADDAARDERSA